MRAAIEYAIFLGTSDDKTVEPDVAVTRLEELASILQELNDSDREQFQSYAWRLAKSEESMAGLTPRVEFLLTLTDNLGLAGRRPIAGGR